MTPRTARRGRPPTHSRATIAEQLYEALVTEPDAPLTIAWMSEVTGVAPMSLYRYFDDRDDIVRAVAEVAFSDTRVPSTVHGTWQEEIADWMRLVFERSTRVPQLVRIIAAGGDRSWVTGSAHLARIVRAAGFVDRRALAEAVMWISINTMGHAMVMSSASGRYPLEPILAEVAHLPAGDAEMMDELVREFAAVHERWFESVVALTITALEARLAALR